jgi:D-glycero-alpha-D-manno-heptose-7-phosphate kinase
MIISRTPFRVSFGGGGTDLESYYAVRDGQVLSTTIDKYIYVCVKRPLEIVSHKYRLAWSRLEYTDSIDAIEHPIVRETLRMMAIDHPLEVVTFADVPAETGLGSSSAFAVGLLHALYSLKSQSVTKYRLATEAAQIEIDRLGRHIGKQDHFAAAYGNLHTFTFHAGGKVSVEPVFYNPATKRHVECRLMLFFTAQTRNASEILEEQVESVEGSRGLLDAMRDLVAPMREVLMSGDDPARFGRLLDESWQLKRNLTASVSNPLIDGYYRKALEAGAVGGKLLGAGGGGFLLLYVEPDHQDAVRQALGSLKELPFRFDDGGSRITYYDER